jgi:hypothetical protein
MVLMSDLLFDLWQERLDFLMASSEMNWADIIEFLLGQQRLTWDFHVRWEELSVQIWHFASVLDL